MKASAVALHGKEIRFIQRIFAALQNCSITRRRAFAIG
jgi:hypothetical protein